MLNPDTDGLVTCDEDEDDDEDEDEGDDASDGVVDCDDGNFDEFSITNTEPPPADDYLSNIVGRLIGDANTLDSGIRWCAVNAGGGLPNHTIAWTWAAK